MPKKIGVIALIIFVSVILVRPYRVNIERVFNQTRQIKDTTKEVSNTEIDSELILGAEDFADIGNKDGAPAAEASIRKSRIQDEVMGYRLKSKNRTKQVQTALKKAGFYKGDMDGKLGPQTKNAVKAFQKSKGLNPDGVVGVRTWEELARISKN